MKVTLVSIRPTQAAEEAGRPALTPELLAATGARYSRNNEGLEAILAKIDPNQPDKSVDSIFKMVDYGHASIADMAPVSMFIDGISMWLAYLVWAQVPTAGGQESSTRYLRLTAEDLLSAEELGIPSSLRGPWRRQMELALDAYDETLEWWQNVGDEEPERTRIPKALLEDESDKALKTVSRMKRNYAFDRARYFLPAALRTNMMLVMSARAWVQLAQWLLSHTLPEANRLGDLVVSELGYSAPRLIRHARKTDAWAGAHQAELDSARQDKAAGLVDRAFLDFLLPRGVSPSDFAEALAHHDNRYGPIGESLKRVAVRFGWDAVAFAEIRDLNRHRTGTKYCPPVPRGFYFAEDEMPEERRAGLRHLATVLRETADESRRQLAVGDPTHAYWHLLGHTFTFEHTTTADKFLYEAELRTGVGAHYRYAKHLRDCLELWYAHFPATRGLVLEGSAEPE